MRYAEFSLTVSDSAPVAEPEQLADVDVVLLSVSDFVEHLQTVFPHLAIELDAFLLTTHQPQPQPQP